MDIEKLKQLKNKKEAWIAGIIGFVILAATNPTPRNYANFTVGSPSQRGLTVLASANDRLVGVQNLYCRKVGTSQGVETRESCWSFIEWETSQNPDFLKEYIQEKVVGRYNFLLFSVYYLDGISNSEMDILPSNASHSMTVSSLFFGPLVYTSIGIFTVFITLDIIIVFLILIALAVAILLWQDKLKEDLKRAHLDVGGDPPYLP